MAFRSTLKWHHFNANIKLIIPLKYQTINVMTMSDLSNSSNMKMVLINLITSLKFLWQQWGIKILKMLLNYSILIELLKLLM